MAAAIPGFSLIAGLAALVILGMPVLPARGSVIYSQNFEGLAGGSLNGQGGFSIGSGPVNVITTGGLSYTSGNGVVSVPGGNNAVSLNPTGANNWALTNTFSAQTSTPIYFSVCMTWSNLSSGSLLYLALSNIGSAATTNPLQNSGGIAINGFSTSSGAYGQIGGRMRGASSSYDTDIGSGITDYPSTTSTQFIVGCLSSSGANGSAYDTLKIWINPTSLTLGTPNVTITQSMGISTVNTLYFFTGTGDGTSELIQLDNITLGTTAADVLPAAPAPTKLAITSVNGGSNPAAGTPFSIAVQAQNASGTATNVVSNTAVSLSVSSGSGTLGGTTTGTIPAGSSAVTISGVTYSAAQAGVVLGVTRTSGDALTAGTSAPFSVTNGVPASTTTTLARSGASSSTYGDNVSFAVTVSGASPTGTVNLYDGGSGGALIGSGTLSSGGCSITVNRGLSAGSHGNIVAVYQGDLSNAPSTSSALSPAQSVAVKPLTITGLAANNKAYDGTTTATLAGTPALLTSEAAGSGSASDGAPYAGDTVAANAASATAVFASASVANGVAVTVSGVTLTGGQAADYSAIQPAGLTANITVPISSGTASTGDVETYYAQAAAPINFANDGIPDLMKQALGLSTMNAVSPASASLYGMSLTPGTLSLAFEEAANVSRYQPSVQASPDLINWTTGNVTLQPAAQAGGDGRVPVSVSVATSGTAEFARLSAMDSWQLNSLGAADIHNFFAKIMVFWSQYVNSADTMDTGASPIYTANVDYYEWSTRMLVPMAAWLSVPGRSTTVTWNGTTVDVAASLLHALQNGTDPTNPAWWGYAANSSDQIVVEAPQVALAVWLLHQASLNGAPGAAVWNSLTSTQLTNIYNFLNNTDSASFAGSYVNNWNMFIVQGQQAMRQLNLAGIPAFSGWSQSAAGQNAINTSMLTIQNLSQGGGWYSDNNQVSIFDDYIAWAVLPDQMLDFIMSNADTQAQTVVPGTSPSRGRSQILADASAWLDYQILDFDANGGNPEFGRSTTYKFGRLRAMTTAYYIDRTYNNSSAWNLGFTVLPSDIGPGMLRRLIRLHLSHYLASGEINTTTGVELNAQTPNSGPGVLESYTHDGSRFWSMLAIAPLLLLPDNDPLWTAPETELPSEQYAIQSWRQTPGILIRTLPAQGHVELFNARIPISSWMTSDYYNKYTKFTYSSLFGYCTQSGSELDQDVMVGGNYRQNPTGGSYYLRYGRTANEPGVIRTTQTQGSASISTLMFLKNGAQVRVHLITGASGQTIADGGYALGNTASETVAPAITGTDWVYMESSVGAQMVARLAGYTSVSVLSGTGNHSRSAAWRIPYSQVASAPGNSFVCAMLIYASAQRFDPTVERTLVKSISISGSTVTITWSDGTVAAADFQ